MANYISKLNLRGADRKHIAAGVPFDGNKLSDESREMLTARGYICLVEEYVAPVKVAPKNARVVGPANNTPPAALEPYSPFSGKESDEDEPKEPADNEGEDEPKEPADSDDKKEDDLILTDEQKDRKAILDELKTVYGTVPNPSCKTSTLRKKLKKAKEGKSKSTAKVWDGNPDELKEMDFSFLISKYIDVCEAYNIKPKIFDKEDKEALIVEMSSEFEG